MLKDFDPSDAVFVPYWEIGSYCEVSPELSDMLAVSMILVGGTRALVAVSNLSDADVQIELRPQLSALCFGSKTHVSDPEAAEPAAGLSGPVSLDIQTENYRLLFLENISPESGFLFTIAGRTLE